MEWKLTGGAPVYQQLMEHFRRAVLSGEYPAGARIPSVRELAAQARVNPNTVQRALWELERERLLESHGTLGRFVTNDQAVLDELLQKTVIQTVRSCAELLRPFGLTLQDAAQVLQKDQNKEV